MSCSSVEMMINGQLAAVGMGKKGSRSSAKTAAELVTSTVVKYLFGADLTIAFHAAWSSAANRMVINTDSGM